MSGRPSRERGRCAVCYRRQAIDREGMISAHTNERGTGLCTGGGLAPGQSRDRVTEVDGEPGILHEKAPPGA